MSTSTDKTTTKADTAKKAAATTTKAATNASANAGDAQTSNGEKLETKPVESDKEKIDLTPAGEQNNVSAPGPTAFATDPEQPPAPAEHALKFENTPLENVGPIPGNNVSAERIVQVWDGGERIVAAKMARESTKEQREKAVDARPELQRYIAGDPG